MHGDGFMVSALPSLKLKMEVAGAGSVENGVDIDERSVVILCGWWLVVGGMCRRRQAMSRTSVRCAGKRFVLTQQPRNH